MNMDIGNMNCCWAKLVPAIADKIR